jgi:hypothetical protein
MLEGLIQHYTSKHATWKFDDLVQTIRNTRTTPNPAMLDVNDIKLAILQHNNLHFAGEYVISSSD